MPLVGRGLTVTESGQIFSDWLYGELCSTTPLSSDVNGVNCGFVNNVPTYYQEILTGLSKKEVKKVVKTQVDPAIVICLKEGAVHEALNLPNAPCRQGAHCDRIWADLFGLALW